MIRALPKADRRRASWLAAREWWMMLVPIAILDVEGKGRSLVLLRFMQTRWSDRQGRRLWRQPGGDV